MSIAVALKQNNNSTSTQVVRPEVTSTANNSSCEQVINPLKPTAAIWVQL